MAGERSRESLQLELQAAVQEDDTARELDSLEVVTIRAYFEGRGVPYPDAGQLPRTIEEWLEWAAPSFKDS